MDNKVLVFSAPSGSGKSTIVNHILSIYQDSMEFSVSATSREPRGEEQNGREYYFLTTGIRGKYLEMNFFIVDTLSCKNQAYISVRATDWIPSMEPSFRIIRSKAALSCTSRSM